MARTQINIEIMVDLAGDLEPARCVDDVTLPYLNGVIEALYEAAGYGVDTDLCIEFRYKREVTNAKT